jgi:glycogen phosphorylase
VTDQVNDGRQDLQRAIAELALRLPLPLAALARLAYNYAWSWLEGGTALFRDTDPGLWRHRNRNARSVIADLPGRRLQELADDRAYVDRLAAFAETLRAYLDGPSVPAGAFDRPVAYCCSEFAIHCSLPIYGGGLGVLAGDLLKAASDAALPMVGVGLLYREGYLCQRLDTEGWQHEFWIPTEFDRLPAVRVTLPDETPLVVDLVIRGRTVRVQVWRTDVGRVPLYLLDTNREDNHPIDRWITDRLYVGDRHTRLAQYAVLGIGGMRALAAMGIVPSVLHLNEGHGALAGFERLRVLLAEGRSLEEALAEVRRGAVFTTHTPVAAGNEGYAVGEIDAVLGDFLASLGGARGAFYDLGRMTAGNQHEAVGITTLALRTTRAANAVSRRHGEVARAMWQPLWPDRGAQKVPIGHVTNGVHTTTWMGDPVRALLARHLGADWSRRLGDAALWDRVGDIPDDALWQARCAQREALVRYVRERSITDRLTRGEPADYVEAAAQVFDPGVLTIGFARRVATYKRLHLLTRLPERALALVGNATTPIQFVIAGKAHPQDHEAKATLHAIFQQKHAVGAHVAYLENYELHMASCIVAGVDLWLNLPRPPLEASGTSGMKVALNGALNLSVLDGWWAEAYDGENGWAIATPDGDPQTQDDHDAAAVFDLLEREVIPLFYQRGADGVPHAWLARVKASMRTLIPRFSAARMLGDYAEMMYAAPGAHPMA